MQVLRYGIGLDMGMEKFDACISVIDADQKVAIKSSRIFNNNRKGYQQLYKWVTSQCCLAAPVIFLMEATGIYHEALAYYLHSHRCSISVVLPNKAKKYKQALGLRSKTDTIDAKSLSRMICEQALPAWVPMSKTIYLLRAITRQIESVSNHITRIKCQLHAQEFTMYKNKEVINCMKQQLKLLQKQKDQLQKQALRFIESDAALNEKFEKICRIKGVGKLSLAVIIAETNGFSLFEKVGQVVSYSGYDVIENQSGKHVGKTRISKQGNGRIRRILHMPAFNVVRLKQKPFYDLYRRVYDRSKMKMKAYTAVQKKLLVVIYTLWKKDAPYDPCYQQTSREKELVLSFV
ncbi:MAG TPA: IS110 family transposase [Chitinophagaceae bacterium]|jgi:transposase|nr:IS110 family transposase [Chitinophagaceae bacterium]